MALQVSKLCTQVTHFDGLALRSSEELLHFFFLQLPAKHLLLLILNAQILSDLKQQLPLPEPSVKNKAIKLSKIKVIRSAFF